MCVHAAPASELVPWTSPRPSGLIPKPRPGCLLWGGRRLCSLLGVQRREPPWVGGQRGALGPGLGPLPASPGEAFRAVGSFPPERPGKGRAWGWSGVAWEIGLCPSLLFPAPTARCWGATVNPPGEPLAILSWDAGWGHLPPALCPTAWERRPLRRTDRHPEAQRRAGSGSRSEVILPLLRLSPLCSLPPAAQGALEAQTDGERCVGAGVLIALGRVRTGPVGPGSPGRLPGGGAPGLPWRPAAWDLPGAWSAVGTLGPSSRPEGGSCLRVARVGGGGAFLNNGCFLPDPKQTEGAGRGLGGEGSQRGGPACAKALRRGGLSPEEESPSGLRILERTGGPERGLRPRGVPPEHTPQSNVIQARSAQARHSVVAGGQSDERGWP